MWHNCVYNDAQSTLSEHIPEMPEDRQSTSVGSCDCMPDYMQADVKTDSEIMIDWVQFICYF